MFYDGAKTDKENSETYTKNKHNREAILLVNAVIACGTCLLVLAITANKAVKEFR